jgi:ABC-type transporter Mla subunit MlaD
MTNGVDGRLDNIDRRLEQLVAITEAHSQQIESNAKSIEALSSTVATVSTAVDGLAAIQQQLVEIISEEREDMREFRATTGAALERIDRVMDYLMKRDGERNSP